MEKSDDFPTLSDNDGLSTLLFHDTEEINVK